MPEGFLKCYIEREYFFKALTHPTPYNSVHTYIYFIFRSIENVREFIFYLRQGSGVKINRSYSLIEKFSKNLTHTHISIFLFFQKKKILCKENYLCLKIYAS